MDRYTWVAMASIAAAGLATPASAVTIGFDVDALGNPIVAGTPITTQYSSLGVTFAGIENGLPVSIVAGPDPDNNTEPSQPNVLSNCNTAAIFCPGNRADIVQMTFSGAASGVSLKLDSLGRRSVTFNAYDASNALIESISQSGTFTSVTFASSGIYRIDGLQPNDGWAWAMDDLTFDIAGGAVPEPATWLFLILGFGVIGKAMRRSGNVRTTVRFAA